MKLVELLKAYYAAKGDISYETDAGMSWVCLRFRLDREAPIGLIKELTQVLLKHGDEILKEMMQVKEEYARELKPKIIEAVNKFLEEE